MRTAAALLVVVASLGAACGGPPPEPLRLDGNLLTVENQTGATLTNVEIWINRQFRVTAHSIPSGGRFQAPLDAFVEGYGRRFNFKSMQVHEVRLTATRPDGSQVELRKAFEATGLNRLGERR
jgi:hypothetical protein